MGNMRSGLARMAALCIRGRTAPTTVNDQPKGEYQYHCAQLKSHKYALLDGQNA